ALRDAGSRRCRGCSYAGGRGGGHARYGGAWKCPGRPGGACCCCCCSLLTRLSDLATDLLALVADALALVGVVLPQTTDVGGDLSDLLLVDARDGQLGV